MSTIPLVADSGEVTGRPQVAVGGSAAPGDSPERAREDFLRRLLEHLESGALSVPEYTERVCQLDRATTIADMAEIAEAAPRAEPALDPVDMLLLSRSAKEPAEGARRPRYFIIGVLLFFFVVLLAVGLWLVSHARSLHNSGNLGTVAAATASAPATAAPPPTLS